MCEAVRLFAGLRTVQLVRITWMRCSAWQALFSAAPASHDFARSAQPTPRSVSCTICTAIVGFAEEKLGSNATLAQIETFLNTSASLSSALFACA